MTFIGNYMITTSVGEIKFNFTKKKKNGACVFLSTVFFLSLLAGNFTTTEQMLLTEL